MTNLEKLIADGPSALFDELDLYRDHDFQSCPRDKPVHLDKEACKKGCLNCWIEWLEKEAKTDE